MISGFALIDKPAGWTSHDVVGRLRRLYGQRRVGHARRAGRVAGHLIGLAGVLRIAAALAEGMASQVPVPTRRARPHHLDLPLAHPAGSVPQLPRESRHPCSLAWP